MRIGSRGLKLAVASAAPLIVTEHEPVPVHAPLYPVNVGPSAGTTVSVTTVSLP